MTSERGNSASIPPPPRLDDRKVLYGTLS